MHHPSRISQADVSASLGVFVVLASLLAPAVVHSTEASRKASCADNLRRIAQGCLLYADASNTYLPNNQVSPFGSWNTQLLPLLDEAGLHDRYAFSSDWWDDAKSENRLVGGARVAAFLCPSAPHADRRVKLRDNDGVEFGAAPSDYVGSAGAYLHTNTVDNLHRGAMAYPGRVYGASGVTARRAVSLREVRDGASHTALVVEMADRPNKWRMQELVEDRLSPETAPTLNPGISSGNWSAPNWNHLRSYDPETGKAFGPCAVNCSNGASLYGFHPEGANVAFADGSARMVRSGIAQEVLIAIVSIAGGEILGSQDYLATVE